MPEQGQKQTGERRDALDTLIALKIPKKEAEELINRALGNTSGEIATNALRLRGGKSQLPVSAPTTPAQPQGAVPVAPAMPAPQPPQTQPQMPGLGPPGGPAAAPTAQELEQFAQGLQGHFRNPQAAPASRAPWWARLMGFNTVPPASVTGPLLGQPAPAPVAPRPAAPTPTPAAVATPVPTQPPAPPSPMPAPVVKPTVPPELQAQVSHLAGKPRIRVKAAGGMVPTQVAQPKEEKAEIQQASKPQELPLVSTQEQYDKLPIGARFKHPDGFIYRKESESEESPQKLQTGGVVKNRAGELPEVPEEKELAPTEEKTSTDSVPAELTPGEYVVPKPAVDQIGAQNLDALTATALGGGAGPMPAPVGGGGAPTAGRTPVGPTGQTVDASGHPILRGLAYGPNSEGATAADMRQLKGAWNQPLQPGDIAVSPNLQKLYPLKSYVDVVDSKGNVVLPHARVADTSMIDSKTPTVDTFEIWNGPSLGRGYRLVPSSS